MVTKEARQQAVGFRVDMIFTCTYRQRINIRLQGLKRCVLTVGAVSGWESYFGTISSVANVHSQQKVHWKSRPVDISQWRQ